MLSVDDRPGAALTAADIRWELSPAPELPTDDLLTDALLAVAAYRQVARAFLHGLRALHVEHQEVREDRQRLRDENRELRAKLRSVRA
jgi:hypothetical protein